MLFIKESNTKKKNKEYNFFKKKLKMKKKLLTLAKKYAQIILVVIQLPLGVHSKSKDSCIVYIMYPNERNKMKKQEIALIKSFMALQENLTNEKQKLSDRYHNLELSHNRKTKALTKIQNNLENFIPGNNIDIPFWEEIRKICTDALFCNGRERSKKCGIN